MRRRDFLTTASVTLLGGVAAACGSSGRSANSLNRSDLPGYFSQFQAADEPNADLTKIVWPSYVTQAGPHVKTLYEFQLTHGELMRYMPCYCGCGQNNGHKNNRDCYVQKVNPDHSAVLDSMAPT